MRRSVRMLLVLGAGALALLEGCRAERPAEAAPRRTERDPSARQAARAPRGGGGGGEGAPGPHARGARAGTSPKATSTPAARGNAGDLSSRYAGARTLATLRGQASYYGDSLAGNKTASGERYDPRALTAAHRTLPFGTVVRVVRADGRAAVVVRITDRGPFAGKRRIIDLSRAAAERLEMIRAGVLDVRVEVVEYGRKRR